MRRPMTEAEKREYFEQYGTWPTADILVNDFNLDDDLADEDEPGEDEPGEDEDIQEDDPSD